MKRAEMQMARLEDQRAVLLQYLRMKIDAGDLHAVADAAMDCREIDAQLAILRDLAQTVNHKSMT